jgi:hypothetical protein
MWTPDPRRDRRVAWKPPSHWLCSRSSCSSLSDIWSRQYGSSGAIRVPTHRVRPMTWGTRSQAFGATHCASANRPIAGRTNREAADDDPGRGVGRDDAAASASRHTSAALGWFLPSPAAHTDATSRKEWLIGRVRSLRRPSPALVSFPTPCEQFLLDYPASSAANALTG